MILECFSLKKSFGPIEAVRGIDLQIPEGKIFGLLGPNGAGKSTLIKMITGLIWPTSGEVFIRGKSVQEDHINALQNVGAIIEWPYFIPYLTARKNLDIFCHIFFLPATGTGKSGNCSHIFSTPAVKTFLPAAAN